MITRETLLTEIASLDQQEAQARETIQRTEAVKRDAEDRINAIHGARQAYNHLLSKIEWEHRGPDQQEQNYGGDNDGGAGAQQEAAGGGASGAPGRGAQAPDL